MKRARLGIRAPHALRGCRVVAVCHSILYLRMTPRIAAELEAIVPIIKCIQMD